MTKAEYRMKLKKEIYKLSCVHKVNICDNELWVRLFQNENINANELNAYLDNNKDKLKIIDVDEENKWLDIKILNIDKYTEPEIVTELDIEIEKLENQLKELKSKRNIERAEQRKKIKILKLKEELKKLEEEN
jgi:hypothetical protein